MIRGAAAVLAPGRVPDHFLGLLLAGLATGILVTGKDHCGLYGFISYVNFLFFFLQLMQTMCYNQYSVYVILVFFPFLILPY